MIFKLRIVSVLFFAFCLSHYVLAQKSNIVFILADDLGWADISMSGGDNYDSPNIDRLAESGIRFTNAYTSSQLCINSCLSRGQHFKRKAIYGYYPHYVMTTNNYSLTSDKEGDWKLLKVYGEGENQGDAFEWYNLKNDEGENHNSVRKMPKKGNRIEPINHQICTRC